MEHMGVGNFWHVYQNALSNIHDFESVAFMGTLEAYDPGLGISAETCRARLRDETGEIEVQVPEYAVDWVGQRVSVQGVPHRRWDEDLGAIRVYVAITKAERLKGDDAYEVRAEPAAPAASTTSLDKEAAQPPRDIPREVKELAEENKRLWKMLEEARSQSGPADPIGKQGLSNMMMAAAGGLLIGFLLASIFV